ncbi:MAG: o-succinylbenzoate--CoA ligase [Sphingomonadales bacterium]|nr:o-succinylbenzoate--CoA ligase [Sphingomonadales bacterium]
MALRFVEPTEEFYQYPLTIGHLLDAALATAGQQEIVYRDQFRLTYQDFRRRLGKLASMLAGLGVVEGATVAVLDWDSHRYLEAYFAVPMMGAVLQTVNVRMSVQQVAYVLRQTAAETLLVHRDFLSLIDGLLPSLPHVTAVVVLADGSDDPLPSFAVGEYEAMIADADAAYPFNDFDENAVATTFHTSGTTGDPKAVCFTHRQIVLHALSNKAPFGATRGRGFGIDDVYMPITPMFHVHAWGMPYIATMLGVKQVYPGRYEPDVLLDLRKREGVSFSHCVPTILQMLLATAAERGERLDGWMMMVGGAALSTTLFNEARNSGLYVIAGYGMSETCPRISLTRRRRDCDDSDGSLAEALTTSGVPVPLVSVRVVDENMKDVPADGISTGELVLRAPWLTAGYVGDPSGSRALWRGGWLHTQDIVSQDSEGFIVVRDRLKDVIKTGGEWISSVALENLILTVPGVAEAAVIGVADEKWGERPIAIVSARRGTSISVAALEAVVFAAIERGELSRYARVDRFETIESLPKTSVGKIDKKQLRTMFDVALAET